MKRASDNLATVEALRPPEIVKHDGRAAEVQQHLVTSAPSPTLGLIRTALGHSATGIARNGSRRGEQYACGRRDDGHVRPRILPRGRYSPCF